MKNYRDSGLSLSQVQVLEEGIGDVVIKARSTDSPTKLPGGVLETP